MFVFLVIVTAVVDFGEDKGKYSKTNTVCFLKTVISAVYSWIDRDSVH